MGEARKTALLQHLNQKTGDEQLALVTTHGDNEFIFDDKEYLVLTDAEADKEQDEYFDHYIDDCLDLPEHVRPYFDEVRWKEDAKFDGRGVALSGYDGIEHEEEVDGVNYYIYRTN